MLFEQQKHEIEQIAQAWGVPPATAAYALLERSLANARRAAPRFGGIGLAAIAIALRKKAEHAHHALTDPSGT